MGQAVTRAERKLMADVIQEMSIDVSKGSQITQFEDLWAEGDFIEEEQLGQGASCRVCKVSFKNKSGSSAMKEMRRNDEFNPPSFVKEIAILHILIDHPNTLDFEGGFLDRNHYYIQTKLLQGGELFDRIHKEKKFSEKETSKHICYILDAIFYCHQRNIVHRDLKPENMVYADPESNAESLTIIDFGDSKYVQDEGSYEEFVGTAFYLPPEIVRPRKGKEMKKSDVWSIGVITYVLLTGRPPFWGNSNKEILKKIIKGKVQFPRSCKLSATAKHFVLNLVQKRIEKRYNVHNALNHPFIRNHNKNIIGEIYKKYGLPVGNKKKSKSQVMKNSTN